jgi:poly(glycerol-phosphate) alpha-glucosyltransferase
VKIAMLSAHLSRRAGGVYEVLLALLQQQLGRVNSEMHLFGIEDGATFPLALEKHVTASRGRGPRAFGYAPGLAKAVSDFQPDLVHSHGIWMFNSWVANRLRKCGTPTVISPHGMLDPWIHGRRRWKKIPIEFWFENDNLRHAHCLHALNRQESETIRALGYRNPIAVIPNGIDLPAPDREDAPWVGKIPGGAKVLLFLGRLHPKKGLEQLLDAIPHLGAESRDWHLAIAGWGDEDYASQLQQRARDLGIYDRTHFLGALFDREKHNAFANADAFILPSWSEGLPMAVLEAWVYRLPVFMTEECNLSEAFVAGEALKISHDPKEIAATLSRYLPSASLVETGLAGSRLAIKKYQWSAVTEQFNALYAWLLRQGPRPGTVQEIQV